MQFGLDNPRNQISGDDEEDVHAYEAAEHRRRFEMERDHREHRYGTQPVDIFTIGVPHKRCLVWLHEHGPIKRKK